MPWYAIAWLSARLWELGSFRRQRGDLLRVRRLPVPVISVGNLTMGGTGKTPSVLRLVQLLKERGRKPGILTRGYGRQSPESYLTMASGQTVSAQDSGDEAQIFIRSGLAPVGIGANRFETGTRLLQNFDIDVLLLDDGFQHRRLARDVDLLLVDALHPFGGGDVFPLGRLREPVAAASRADAILITRCISSDLTAPIVREIRRWNPKAPIFESSVRPLAWVDFATAKRFSLHEMSPGPIGAFCGVGNPASFRRTLERLGIEIADWIEFDDHHRYRPHELRHIKEQTIASGAKALVTTEKDAMNLREDTAGLVAPLPLYYLEISIEIEREAELLESIVSRL